MASDPIRVEERIRFGEDFELEVSARRLCRDGHTLKLERIPLEILVLLLGNRGEIVTRDEIVAKVWGKGAFLDTDNSIRGAIRKIRQVLKDDPEYPQFIQTVTGQGYRFIAPVIRPDEGNDAGVSKDQSSTVPKGGLIATSPTSEALSTGSFRSSVPGCKAADCVCRRKEQSVGRRRKQTRPLTTDQGNHRMRAAGLSWVEWLYSHCLLSPISRPGTAPGMRLDRRSSRWRYCL
jgi:DNA-binding winged helix-turn-helix (wHTH) protein